MGTLARLQILQTLTRGRVETYRAFDPENRQHVLVHYADSALFDVADQLANEVLDWGQTADRHYIVTSDRAEYEDLNSRIKPWPNPDLALRNAGRWTTASPPSRPLVADLHPIAPPKPAPNAMPQKDQANDNSTSPEQGEFTRMFQPPKPSARDKTPELAPADESPGEFTRMFQAAKPQPQPQPLVPAKPAEAATSSPQPYPTEQSPAPEPVYRSTPEISSPAEPAASQPARFDDDRSDQPRPEFTRIFQRPPQPQRPNRPSAPQSAPPPPVPSSEATNLFKPSNNPANPIARTPKPAISEPPPPPPPAVAPAPAAPAPVYQPPPAASPSEFTSLFSSPVATPPPVPAESRNPPPPPQQQPKPATQAPGNFTDFFRQPAPTPQLEPPAAPPPAAPAKSGSFTDFFRQPTAQPHVQKPAATPQSPQGSEFTRFFEDPLGSASKPVDWNAVQNQPAPPPREKPAGDFTRMFGKGGAAEQPKSPFAPLGTREGATDIFQSSSGKPGPADARSQIDDFGRLFANTPQAQPAAPTPPQPAPPAQAESASPIGKKLPKAPPLILLILLIAAIVVLAGCAFYYFVLRK